MTSQVDGSGGLPYAITPECRLRLRLLFDYGGYNEVTS